MTRFVIGWKLAGSERDRLLDRFPPQYHRAVADHVTLEAGVAADTPLPRSVDARIVGRADDGDSLECLVVTIDGTSERPDGSTYHLTWSLGAGRKARESNDVVRDCGWTPIDRAVPIAIEPARFRW